MKIRRPDQKEVMELKQIWKVCFEDSDHYIDFYFKHCFQLSRTLVCEEDGMLVGMMTVLPSLLYTKTSIIKGGYIYAVATLPEYRGRGIMSKLEEAAKKFVAEQNGSFLTLVPAKKSLFTVYEGLGYEYRYSLYDLEMTAQEAATYASLSNLGEVNESYFIILRQLYLNSFLESIQFDGHLQHYFCEELKQSGCKAMSVQNRFGHGLIVYTLVDGELYIREVAMKPECFEAALYAIMEKLQVKKAYITSAGPLFQKGKKRPYGMIKYLDEKTRKQKHKIRYMNLMLD